MLIRPPRGQWLASRVVRYASSSFTPIHEHLVGFPPKTRGNDRRWFLRENWKVDAAGMRHDAYVKTNDGMGWMDRETCMKNIGVGATFFLSDGLSR